MPTTEKMIDALEAWRKDPASLAEDHFWKLVEGFRAELVNQAFAILGQQSDAEDVAQDTLVAAFLNLEKLREPKMLKGWIRRINQNAALEHRERGQRQRNVANKAGREKKTVLTSHTRAVTHQELVARAIDALPEELRSILVLRYWENLDYQGIAHRLGIPLGTVKSRMARADRQLEKKLIPLMGLQPIEPESVRRK